MGLPGAAAAFAARQSEKALEQRVERGKIRLGFDERGAQGQAQELPVLNVDMANTAQGVKTLGD
jgi:hypothetical protein